MGTREEEQHTRDRVQKGVELCSRLRTSPLVNIAHQVAADVRDGLITHEDGLTVARRFLNCIVDDLEPIVAEGC